MTKSLKLQAFEKQLKAMQAQEKQALHVLRAHVQFVAALPYNSQSLGAARAERSRVFHEWKRWAALRAAFSQTRPE